MKKIIICTGLILSFGVFGFGQKQKQQPDAADSNNSKRSTDRGVFLASGTQIDGQLQGAVDVKKSRVGDQVVLKTTKSIKQNGETVVPKGANLIGRITEVQQKAKSNGQSRLGMVFDRIEGKNLAAPIRASISSITDANANSRSGDTADADVFGSSNTSSSTSAGASGSGSRGGGNGGLLGGVGGTVGGAVNTTTQTVGDLTNTVGQTARSTGGTLGQTINGIQISNAADGSVQSGTTLSSADKNIRLEKGVMIQLQLSSSVRVQ